MKMVSKFIKNRLFILFVFAASVVLLSVQFCSDSSLMEGILLDIAEESGRTSQIYEASEILLAAVFSLFVQIPFRVFMGFLNLFLTSVVVWIFVRVFIRREIDKGDEMKYAVIFELTFPILLVAAMQNFLGALYFAVVGRLFSQSGMPYTICTVIFLLLSLWVIVWNLKTEFFQGVKE